MNQKRNIAIFGAGGFGLEVAMLIEQINSDSNQMNLIGFFDDATNKGDVLNDYPLLGGMAALDAWSEKLEIVCAIGNPQVKKAVLQKITNPRISFPTLIHPSVIMGNRKYVSILEGGIICAGTIITTNIRIGRHVLINLACTVGHESSIGDYSSFMPMCNISGQVTIGECTYWGTGSKIINGYKVGKNTIIGAGAVVVNDIPNNALAVGVPAKVVKQHN